MSSLNNRISSLSNQVSIRERNTGQSKIWANVMSCLSQASRTEKIARDKEAAFAKDQQLAEKKVILTDKIGVCAEQEKKVSLLSLKSYWKSSLVASC
jgi:hypothetical protein